MTTGPTLVLRADGGPGIGGGHVMRCLALAQAWGEGGGRAVFGAATLAPSLRQRLLDEGFDCIAIEAASGSPADAEATAAAAASLGARVIVVDGYQFPVAFHQRLHDAGMKIAAVDDNGEIGTGVADLVINQNRHASPALYAQRAGRARLLLGTEYALLRREFRTWQGPPRTFPVSARQLLVTLGAADPLNVTAEVIACVGPALAGDIAIVVVIGGSNPHADAITARAVRLPNCRLLRDPGSDMPGLMAAADLAVCAGGSTMWEMARMGVPFIPIVIAENQRLAVAAMARDGYPTVDGAAVARDLPAAVAALAADAGRREALSRRGRQLVDGRGAERVCTALRELTSNLFAHEVGED
jgi:UDP-2,4-diacetamido-2,4,6-trideoxy-beta-L-altropyranose hydrolase